MTDLIPRTVLFGNPERTSPRLSPDGTRLAWIAPHDGVLNVWVAPLRANPGQDDTVDWAAAQVVTDDQDRGIRMFFWAHDARHLLYLQDTGGDENWRLHDVNLETMLRRDLTPFKDVQVQPLASNKKFPTEILVGLNRDNPQLHDVYRLDLLSGDLTLVEKNPGFAGWEADEALVIRAAYAPLPDGGMNLMVRDTPGAEWRQLMSFPADDATTSGVVSFSQDGQSLLVITPLDANTARLLRVDVATGNIEVLAEDAEADVDGVVLHPDTREPQIVLIEKDREEFIVLDPAIESDLKAVRALHPGDPSISGREFADLVLAGHVLQRRRAGVLLRLRPGHPLRAVPVRRPPGAEPVPAGGHGAVQLHLAGRPDHPRLRHVPARCRPGDLPRGRRARRPAGPGRMGLRPRGPVAGQPRLPVRPGQLPRLHRLRQGLRQRRRPRVGRQDARRPDRRGGLHRRPGLGRPGQGRDLRRLLRRVRGPGRGGVHPGRVLLRGGHRRPVEPQDPAGDDPALLGADDRPALQAGRQPRDRRRVPVVAVAAVPGPRHPHPAADRPGRQRPAGQAGRVRADRGRAVPKPGSTTSTCCSPTRATASPSRRTG